MDAPKGFKLSPTIKKELPESEAAVARETLWEKAGLLCALCGLPLPPDGKGIDVDHIVARMEGEGGETKIDNLYLAHRACNRSRQNQPFDVARAVIGFQTWCQEEPERSFADVVNKYVESGNKRIKYTISDDEVEIRFGTQAQRANIFIDPATETKFFFTSVPVSFIQNDADTQPRRIEHDHVRKLAIDFAVHPVHEPSNCRLVSAGKGVADLLQFDGQHKTTAQIILGRTEVPTKIYIEPSEPMLQELVVQIQQGIKKRPLSTSATLRKLDDVVKDKIAEYKKTHGQTPTEIELVEAQPKQDQTAFKKKLLENIEFAIFDDDDGVLKEYAGTKSSSSRPFTDTVVIKKLIKPFVCQELLDDPLDNAVRRDTEREAVLHVLNRIAENMLSGKWHPQPKKHDEDLHTRRARNFFYQGSIGFWLGHIFVVALAVTIPNKNRLFLSPLSNDLYEKVDSLVDTICGWPIWSTTEEDQLAAMRSNTVKQVVEKFPDYDAVRLIQESHI